ncbi:MAG: hypothetical protein K2I72_02910 [Bacilli bacterium]|nr:hypothetical protein [Bacilli bacterium]
MEGQKQEIIITEEQKIIIEDKDKKSKEKKGSIKLGFIGCALMPLLIGGSLVVSWVRDPDRPKKSFVYEATDDGKIEATGRVKYDEVKNNWFLLEKQLKNGESKLYIVDKSSITNHVFVNIHTDKKIASAEISYLSDRYYSDQTILNAERLEPYLITYDMVYDSYTIDDMDWLLELIEADYEYSIPDESNKVMMQTNE